MSPYSDNLGRHQDALRPSSEDLEWLSSSLPQLQADHPALEVHQSFSAKSRPLPGELALPEDPACSIGIFGFVILPDGRVSVCERLAHDPAFIVGDLRHQTIEEVWRSPVWSVFASPKRDAYRGTQCCECEDFDVCTILGRRCIVRTMCAYGRVFGPDPNCPKVRCARSVVTSTNR